MSKAGKRRLLKEEKAERLAAANARLQSKIAPFVKQPKLAPIEPLLRKPKTATEPKAEKKARVSGDPHSALLDLRMTWCTNESDRAEKWSWDEPRNWSDQEFANEIQPAFAEMARLNWGAILNDQKVPAKGNKHVPRHHYQGVNTLCQEAQDRWAHLDLEQYDQAFRFRFGNKKRAWGIRLHAHFYLIWWERNHLIYPLA
ncbi:hypothetical protein [Ralstonia pickettii]|uniref:hypothetical protein n=1 Tax=Ralstonia pickettii TaxID=329 RepID=UPI0015BE11AB|nr:hypothetical protein [Ralstonia pickettii]NWK42867.1 hypothetical protein [Ralstonia pickettii]